MKVGVFAVLFSDRPLGDALEYVSGLGVEAVELGCGNYPGDAHVPVKDLLANAARRDEFRRQVEDRGLTISALSCHGNPLHPNTDLAKAHHAVQRDTLALAEKLGVGTVVVFSGCPGESDKATRPNWVTCPWPPDFSEVLAWQWEKKVIPYWTREAKVAAEHGVKLAFEMHPGFVVYNTESLLRLRKACGKVIGANFDPSHLFWQGMDPIACVRALQGCIWHVHAKDCRLYPANALVNGVLDTKSYTDELNRSWIFRTVGYGHGEDFWKDFVSTLRMTGYDGVLSIEHEDSLMSAREGFEKAVAFLKGLVLSEKPGKAYWA
jgi:sugar phosphate isomerase/epimerase